MYLYMYMYMHMHGFISKPTIVEKLLGHRMVLCCSVGYFFGDLPRCPKSSQEIDEQVTLSNHRSWTCKTCFVLDLLETLLNKHRDLAIPMVKALRTNPENPENSSLVPLFHDVRWPKEAAHDAVEVGGHDRGPFPFFWDRHLGKNPSLADPLW